MRSKANNVTWPIRRRCISDPGAQRRHMMRWVTTRRKLEQGSSVNPQRSTGTDGTYGGLLRNIKSRRVQNPPKAVSKANEIHPHDSNTQYSCLPYPVSRCTRSYSLVGRYCTGWHHTGTKLMHAKRYGILIPRGRSEATLRNTFTQLVEHALQGAAMVHRGDSIP